MSNIELGAYFYPNSTICPNRQSRAQQLTNKPLEDETELVQTRQPLFTGHDQPRIYCLGDPTKTHWDDANIEDMEQQIILATDYGLKFFIFDTYIGTRDGMGFQEFREPLDAFLQANYRTGEMKFGLMCVLGKARVRLPMPLESKGVEPDREIDLNLDTVRYLVDTCVKKYWECFEYFRIKGRPYLSLYFPAFTSYLNKKEELNPAQFIQATRAYAQKTYGINPYILGVILNKKIDKQNIDMLRAGGIDALTGYAFLPEFEPWRPSIQDYKALWRHNELIYPIIRYLSHLPFIPPVVVGFDASPRADRKASFDDLKGTYPTHPIVTDSSPDAFFINLISAISFIQSFVPPEERHVPIAAWNEITEGYTLLPRLRENCVDFGYLEVVKNATLLDHEQLTSLWRR